MPAHSKRGCDVDDLLDEVNTLLLMAPLDRQHATLLIGKLRDCANEAREIGLADRERRLRRAVDDLEKRLLAT